MYLARLSLGYEAVKVMGLDDCGLYCLFIVTVQIQTFRGIASCLSVSLDVGRNRSWHELDVVCTFTS